MKKLKIFLLLGILLCIGFAISPEVHAQGDGPKPFGVGQVLPVTTQLRIYFNGGVNAFVNSTELTSDSNNFYFIVEYDLIFCFDDGEIYFEIFNYDEEIWVSPFNGTTHNYMDIDTSSWSLSKRTISNVGDSPFTWEDLAPAPSGYTITFEENGGTPVTDLSGQTVLPNPLPIPTKEGYTFVRWYYDSSFTQIANAGDPIESDVILYAMWSLTSGPKIFEVGDVLPVGLVRISWDETDEVLMGAYFLEKHQVKSNNNSFNFIERIENNYYITGFNVMTRPEPGIVDFVPPYTVYGGGHSYVDVNTSDWSILKRTISYVFWYETVTFNSKLYWEDITPDGYTQGYLEARDEFAYYDSRTDEWISVSEYLNRYGTDKMNQSDFYNNFDKYFIPAMIIVFGGAIVLTILKVFKGRE